jgi:hypothetical protein
MKKTFLSSLAAFLIMISSAFSQDVPGCTDPQANNYDSGANVNDGSCTYNPTIFTPPLLYILPEDVNETSGLIYEDGYLWTINDSGGEPALYKIDTVDGSIDQIVTISDAVNIDWEALAQDENYIYIGDFGNNSGGRENLEIYKVNKADLPESENGSVTSELISFVYSDYEKPSGQDDNNFDCEALIAIEDSLYLHVRNSIRSSLIHAPIQPGKSRSEIRTWPWRAGSQGHSGS